jgi:hypothetical protein
MIKRAVLLFTIITISITVKANTYECESSGKITYQDNQCNATLCMNEQPLTDTINLFDKMDISKLRVQKGKILNTNTEILLEIDAINSGKNRIKITTKYDGIDKDGFTVNTQTLLATIESYGKIRINNYSTIYR